MKKILVVCTGNICRSPLAEFWLRQQLGEEARVESAGTGALVGMKADPLAIEVGHRHGLDLDSHIARQVTPTMLRDADLVLAMEGGHRRALLEIAPWAQGKVWRFGHASNEDVADPYGLGRDVFESVFGNIARLGSTWLKFARNK